MRAKYPKFEIRMGGEDDTLPYVLPDNAVDNINKEWEDDREESVEPTN